MRYTNVVATAALSGLAVAHGILPGTPQFLGGRKLLSVMKGKRAAAAAPEPEPVTGPAAAPQGPWPRSQSVSSPSKGHTLESRQDDSLECGPEIGSCDEGYCCSPEGYCGDEKYYCSAPDCQQDYGPACHANQIPAGADTSSAPRPKVGSVSYDGVGIYECTNPGDIAITFDDGPYSYTSDLLDKLAAYDAKVTFFMTGNNLGKGQINDPTTPYPAIVQRMHSEGHQIASHTWSHQNASVTSEEQFRQQIVYNEIALNDILGFFPTYFRPPYSICPEMCQSVLNELGYHITYFDMDTEGYLHNGAAEIQTSIDILDAQLPNNDKWLHIEHDIQYYVVYSFMDHMLATLAAGGWNMVTVGDCLSDPFENWYRTIDGSAVTRPDDTPAEPEPEEPEPEEPEPEEPEPEEPEEPETPTYTISTDSSCGDGVTCIGSIYGQCCSQYGWCGDTSSHCDLCQAEYGCGDLTGGGDPVSSPTPPANTPAADTVSTDGSCGNGIICPGSTFGDCCSQHGWCGSTAAYCGDGCQSGTCMADDTDPGTSPNDDGEVISTDGTCGDGVTCEGSEFGDCCSQYGWCGDTLDHCGDGCQPEFGTCSI